MEAMSLDCPSPLMPSAVGRHPSRGTAHPLSPAQCLRGLVSALCGLCLALWVLLF